VTGGPSALRLERLDAVADLEDGAGVEAGVEQAAVQLGDRQLRLHAAQRAIVVVGNQVCLPGGTRPCRPNRAVVDRL